MSDKCCEVFFALGDANRIKILETLKETELCVSDICRKFDITQPSVSHHLDLLKRAGLVKSEKRGREVYYSFNRDAIIECCGQQLEVFKLKLTRK